MINYLEKPQRHNTPTEGLDWSQPVVSIRCTAYNHEPYIRDALEGFVMQETTFPFEAIVHDDASTDNTAEIIREYAEKYPHIIKPIYQTVNQYSQKNGGVKKACIAKLSPSSQYIAFCEGDDYWIDPQKLQKQVDFLETHPDNGMCYSNFNILNQETGEMQYNMFNSGQPWFKKKYATPEEFVINKGYVCPPSWLYRRELSPYFKNVIASCDGTFVWFTDFLSSTKVHAFDEVMAVYRILPESASHSKNPQKKLVRYRNLLETQLKLIDFYNLNPSTKDICIQNHYTEYLMEFIEWECDEEVRNADRLLKHRTWKQRAYIRMYFTPFRKIFFKIVHWLSAFKH